MITTRTARRIREGIVAGRRMADQRETPGHVTLLVALGVYGLFDSLVPRAVLRSYEQRRTT